MSTPKLSVSHVEDHQDRDGVCGHCQRENLRWIMVLSDGTKVGSSCMKKVLGWSVPTKKIDWVVGKTLVATKVFTSGGETVTYTLWTTEGGRTSEARNGYLNSVGGARADWERRGWL